MKNINFIKIISSYLILSFVLSTVPVVQVLAEENEATSTPPEISAEATEVKEEAEGAEESATTTSEIDTVTSTEEISSSTPEIIVEVEEEEKEATSTATTTEVIPPDSPVPEIIQEETSQLVSKATSSQKFKKDKNRSQEEELRLIREHLLNNNLGVTALARLDEFEKNQTVVQESKGFFESITEYVTNNTDEAKAKREAEKISKKKPFNVETFEGKIEKRDAEDYEKDFPLDKTKKNLIEKLKDLIKNRKEIVSGFFETKKALATLSDNPNDYLSEGNEVKFSQSVKDQADLLEKNPLKIFNFVRNNITFIPYYGSKKGSDATLVELAGNDMDKASLMIAMLRYSNIPARYKRANIKVDIRTMTDLLGVETADAAYELLNLNDIPSRLYTLNSEPYFFAIEHVYVEAHLPYGYSRGADLNDGGEKQWVPMDPSINAYYFEQLVDVVDHLKNNDFVIEDFYKDYLNNNYGALEPLDAFKKEVADELTSNPPTYYPDLTYDDALTKYYPKIQNLEFIPGALPYEISSTIDTYDYLPENLRHTLKFIVKDQNDAEALNHTAFISDIANSELLVTYDAATSDDQSIIDSFETIYDVVPLSLVTVRPVIKVNGSVIASGNTTSTLGQRHKYSLEFIAPNGDSIGDPIVSEIQETLEKSTVSGGSEAIAINTDRVIPSELRPTEDTSSSSFVSDQILYSTALDYLNRLQYSHDELAEIIGGGFVNVATKASVFNGITVTKRNGTPYSFDWNGLRIDAYSKVKYFNRFNSSIKTHRKEFASVFGLQASQDESDIFEENFGAESVATVKGLKKVSKGDFTGTTMKKITSENQSEIDSLGVSSNVKNIFRTAIADGKVIYTPTKAVTYGAWNGLFYILVDFSDGSGSYTIGEGLNGGYTVEEFSSGWSNLFRTHLLPGLTAVIITPSNNQTFLQGTDISWWTEYISPVKSWTEELKLNTKNVKVGSLTLRSGYGTNASVNINIKKEVIGTEGKNGNNDSTLDQEINDTVNKTGLPTTAPDFRKVLKLMFQKETKTETHKVRYEPCIDKDYIYPSTIDKHPFSSWRMSGKMPTGPNLVKGIRVDSLKVNHDKTPQEMIKDFTDFGMILTDLDGDGTLSIYEVWKNNDGVQNYSGPKNDQCNSTRITPADSQPAQLLLASSYGIGQVLYGLHGTDVFDKTKLPTPARDIWDLFIRSVNINMAATVMKNTWDKSSGISGSTCNTGDRLWTAIKSYNGSGTRANAYATDICGKYINF